jgi:hypothetical protein
VNRSQTLRLTKFVIQSASLISNKEVQREAVQNELDDLLMVFGDVEEKVAKYKVRHRSFGLNHSGMINFLTRYTETAPRSG